MLVENPAFWALIVGGSFAVIALLVQLVIASQSSTFLEKVLYMILFGGLGAGIGYLGTYVYYFIQWGNSVS